MHDMIPDMINITRLKPDRLSRMLQDATIEANHVHLAEKGDRWMSNYHWHDSYEFCYVLGGKGIYCISGKEFNFEQGDIFIAAPGQKHYESCNRSNPSELIFLTVTVKRKNKVGKSSGIFKLPLKIHVTPGKIINYLFLGILDEIIQRRTGYALKIRNYLSDLLIELYRFIYEKARSSADAGTISANYKKSFAEKMCKYVEVNYHKKIGLKNIAREFHLAPQYISTLFKKQTGYSPVEYITKMRIESAKELLANSEDKVSSIALSVGYDTSHYFHRIFRKVTGTTPIRYREMSISIRKKERL